ncbi:MAG: SRPBCC domain-containing protein [Candidatus Paceibacterota bacterium]
MQKIHIETIVHANIEKVWKHWNDPESIKSWAFATDTWECPHAENDLKVGGRFLTRMSAKDGSESFDFTGTYTEVEEYKSIKYVMDKAEGEENNRECDIFFSTLENGDTKIVEEFSPEETNSVELQKAGWSAILENFKKYVEQV